jgi:hypothetical protein
MNIIIIMAFAPFSPFGKLYLTSFLNVSTIFLNIVFFVDLFFHILPFTSSRAVNIIIQEVCNIDEAGSKVENKFVIIFIFFLFFLFVVFL